VQIGIANTGHNLPHNQPRVRMPLLTTSSIKQKRSVCCWFHECLDVQWQFRVARDKSYLNVRVVSKGFFTNIFKEQQNWKKMCTLFNYSKIFGKKEVQLSTPFKFAPLQQSCHSIHSWVLPRYRNVHFHTFTISENLSSRLNKKRLVWLTINQRDH
jgi:hypothetical protein